MTVKTVLVLDDEPGNRKVMCAILERSGFTPLEAATGAEALKISGSHEGPIDLFVADVHLPDQSGVDVAAEILRRCPETRVLFVSGTPIEGWAQRDVLSFCTLPRDRTRFVSKPFRASDLAEAVESLAGRRCAARGGAD